MDKKQSLRGFTLIELSIVMVVSGLILIGLIQVYEVYQEKRRYEVTKDNLGILDAALNDFVAKNGRYPCPAPQDAAKNTPAYLKEDCTGALGTIISPGGRDTPADANATPDPVMVGTIPTRTLSISDSNNADGWKRFYKYAVTAALTVPATYDNDYGAISIVDKATPPNSVITPPDSGPYILFSMGEKGIGAFTTNGVQTEACTGTAIDIENCNDDSLFVKSADLGLADTDEYFDDVFDFTKTKVANATIPTGAIMAFDTPNCPVGWSDYNDASGRVIVGTGSYTETLKDVNGNPTTTMALNYALGSKAGETLHTLTMNEMPTHRHNVMDGMDGGIHPAELDWFADPGNTPSGGPPDNLLGIYGDGGGPFMVTDYTGGSQPQENRQPYIALKYCRKD